MAADHILIDDALLIEELLVGLDRTDGARLHTTSSWYYRLCRASVLGAGGHLSGPFLAASERQQGQATARLLELPDGIGLPEPRRTVPAMAALAARHRRLNLLNLEAVATAQVLGAEVWLSGPSAAGILPPVLEAEGVVWSVQHLG